MQFYKYYFLFFWCQDCGHVFFEKFDLNFLVSLCLVMVTYCLVCFFLKLVMSGLSLVASYSVVVAKLLKCFLQAVYQWIVTFVYVVWFPYTGCVTMSTCCTFMEKGLWTVLALFDIFVITVFANFAICRKTLGIGKCGF